MTYHYTQALLSMNYQDDESLNSDNNLQIIKIKKQYIKIQNIKILKYRILKYKLNCDIHHNLIFIT